MIHFTLCTDGQARSGGAELLQDWRAGSDSWLWIDLIDEPAAHEQQLLCDELGLDDMAVEEAQRPRHPPRCAVFPNHLYLLVKPLDSESDDLDFSTMQLAVFAAPRLLVTRHSKPSRFLTATEQRYLHDGCGNDSPLDLTAAILRRLIDRYGNILLDLERRLDEIEDDLFDTRSDRLMQELVGYNTALRKMRRILAYHTRAFDTLRNAFTPERDPQWAEEFADIYNLMERFNSLAELYQNVITDLIDAYISLNGHHLNQIMKVLTVVTVMFVPLSLLVGIYGMNFEYMPELKSHRGYFILLTVMGAIATGLLLLFRRIRWL